MKCKREECSAGRSLPVRIMVLVVAETLTRPDMERSASAASIWFLYSAAAAVMVGSAFLISSGAAGALDFFSTTFTGVGTGSDFAGTGTETETGAGTGTEELGCSVVVGAGLAAGSESEGEVFRTGGVAGEGTSWRGRLFSSCAA